METARCKAFLLSAETGSFTRAAEKLNYTPSGVSQLVGALEDDLGFLLLRRSKKGVMLTEEGAQLLPAVRSFLQQEERLYACADEMRGLLTGKLTIAAYSSIATHWLPAILRAFQEAHPNIQIHLMEGIRQEVTAWLDEGLADIGFLSYQEPMPYDWFPIYEDPMLAVLPKNHPLAAAASYPLKRCQEERFIMPAMGRDADVAELLARHELTPPIAFPTLENYAAMSMIESGLGMSVMNELITLNWDCDVVKLPLDPPEHITLGIAVPHLSQASPATKTFLKVAMQIAAG